MGGVDLLVLFHMCRASGHGDGLLVLRHRSQRCCAMLAGDGCQVCTVGCGFLTSGAHDVALARGSQLMGTPWKESELLPNIATSYTRALPVRKLSAAVPTPSTRTSACGRQASPRRGQLVRISRDLQTCSAAAQPRSHLGLHFRESQIALFLGFSMSNIMHLAAHHSATPAVICACSLSLHCLALALYLVVRTLGKTLLGGDSHTNAALARSDFLMMFRRFAGP